MRAFAAALALFATTAYSQVAAQMSGAATGSALPSDPGAHPAEVAVGHSATGDIFTNLEGQTLYALDLRVFRSFYGGAQPCNSVCERKWMAFAAPDGAMPVGDWKAIKSTAGTQWTWKGNPVFLFREDSAGSVHANGYEDMWSVIAYVPPPPDLVAPAAVSIVYRQGGYLLTDDEGHRLFTGSCSDCTGWRRLEAGLANHAVGDWQIARDGDHAQWLYKGKPVFVATGELPTGASAIHP